MLLDVHTHLDLYEGKMMDLALGEIDRNQIFSVSNSMDFISYRKNCDLAKKCKYALPIFGIHPWNAHLYVDKLDSLEEYVEESLMIGEIGLDYHFVKDTHRLMAQQRVFEFLLNEAKRLNKIVILHTKGAEDDVLRMLKHYNIERAIIHWYSGPIEKFFDFSREGYIFTIGFMVLHSDFIRVMARKLPINQILTETDNPGGLQWYAGKIGMPILIKDIIREIARIRNRNKEEITSNIWDNFMQILTYDERNVIMSCMKKQGHGVVERIDYKENTAETIEESLGNDIDL